MAIFGSFCHTTITDGKVQVALVLDAFDRWTLPKAKCADDELSDSAAKRAMKEDFGIEAEIKSVLGEHEFIAHDPDIGRVVRTVGYFLVSTPEAVALTVGISGGIKDARWFSEDTLKGISIYEDLLEMIESGIQEAKRLWP